MGPPQLAHLEARAPQAAWTDRARLASAAFKGGDPSLCASEHRTPGWPVSEDGKPPSTGLPPEHPELLQVPCLVLIVQNFLEEPGHVVPLQ